MKTFGCCHLLLLINPILSFGITSSIRTLVTKHAFASYFMNELVNEVADKPIILHNIISLSHSKVDFGVSNGLNGEIVDTTSSFGLEFTTLSIIYYVIYKFYYNSISSFYNKFHKLPEFKKYYRKFKFCIFVLIIVLTKEIENAI
jgi:hypothetical protein